MKCIVVFSFILTTVEICISTASEMYYVLSDDSTNASCPSQPCATLSQYWLHNGTLPVVSNVEYHFLPGEHHVPANMVLENLHNFSMIGIVSNSSSPVVLVCSHAQSNVIDIINSHFVIIKNVWFKHYDNITLFNKTVVYTNLKISCCFSCRIENVTFVQYAFIAFNLIGDTYMHNIKIIIIQFSGICCQQFRLVYNMCPSWIVNNTKLHKLTMNKFQYNAGVYIDLKYLTYNVQLSLQNSHFSNMNRRAIHIEGGCSFKTKTIFVTNCTFTAVQQYSIIEIILKSVNISIRLLNIKFHDNQGRAISIRIVRFPGTIGCKWFTMNNKYPAVINISFIKFQISSTIGSLADELLIIENEVAPLTKAYVHVLLESFSITNNKNTKFGIIMKKVTVHFHGPVDIYKNKVKFSIIQFQSSIVLFSGTIKLHKNNCNEVILLGTQIKILEYANISFVKNVYRNSLLAVERTEEYNQPYPLCLFQYIAMNRNTTESLSHYNIKFYRNYIHHSSAKTNICSVTVSFSDIITHCKWLPSAVFYNHSPMTINKQIIQNDDKNC